mgnify:CR=1 FL=1
MISELVEMLGYCRPAGSETEEQFIDKFLDPLDVMYDEYGNVWKEIGDKPKIMWSSHTDTVHKNQGIVPILIDGNTARVNPKSGASCLGADCTTGVWLMMEMIRKEVPGVYIFHRAEEIGCQGSDYIAKTYTSFLKKLEACIAFDRYGTTSVITHQMGQRGCSEKFAGSLIQQLPGFKTDNGGSFTDSYTYFDLIPECTNLSVGYYSQHGMKESQNLSFAQQMRDWMVEIDPTKFIIDRDPSIVEYESYKSYYGGVGSTLYDMDDGYWSTGSKAKSLCDLVRRHPQEAADLMELYGVSTLELQAHIDGEHSFYG